MLFIYGKKKVISNIGEVLVKCPFCEAHNWADIMVFSYYYHVYWIPIFPFDKEANLICAKCGAKRYEVPFTKKLVSNFEEIKGKFRHPWYTYIGITLFLSAILLIIVAALSQL